MTYPVSGTVLSYTRDALDRVDVISRSAVQVVDYTYNGSRVIEKAYPGSTAQYTYDTFGRLTQVLHEDTSSGHTLARFDYGYNASHQVINQDKVFYDDVNNTRITSDTSDKGDQYDYDGSGRVVTVLRGVPTAYITDPIASNISNTRYDHIVEYVLDQTGNRLTRKIDGSNDKTYAYNTSNEMTTEGGTTQLYYDNGTYKGPNIQLHKYTADDHYAWFKRSGSLNFTWHYDALGRQIARTKAGSGNPDDIHNYFDGQQDIETTTWISSTETLARRSVYGDAIDEILEHTDYRITPTPYYAHADKLGSIVFVVTASGAIEESLRYTEYGQTSVLDNTFTKLTTLDSAVGNWKRYTGRERALPAALGDDWYFYRARMYRPDAGRFLQRDPAPSEALENAYWYATSNPISLIDPFGLTPADLEVESHHWCHAETKVEKEDAGGAAIGCEATFVVNDPQSNTTTKVNKIVEGDNLPPDNNGDPQYVSNGDCDYVGPGFISHPCSFNLDLRLHIDIASCPGPNRGPGSWVRQKQSGGVELSSEVTEVYPVVVSGATPTAASGSTKAPPWGEHLKPAKGPVSGSFPYHIFQDIPCGGSPSIQTVTWFGTNGSYFKAKVTSSCGPACPGH